MIVFLLLTSSCSKDKEKPAGTRNDSTARTVDLGEDGAGADDDRRGDRRRGRPRRGGPETPDGADAQMAAELNAQAQLGADGTPLRGRPARELESEEQALLAIQDNQEGGLAQPSDEIQDAFDFTSDPAPRAVRSRTGLDIEKLISIGELREITGYSGVFVETLLQGQRPDDRYNAVRLATDDPKQLGFAIQVWKPGNDSAAQRRFQDLHAQSFGGEKVRDVATDAFAASHHGLQEFAFFDRGKRATVLLSCSAKICTRDQLKSISQIILRRL